MSVPDIHKIKIAFILGCIFFLVGTSLVFSQKVEFEPVYYNITTEHGLPSMETYSVKQDSKGYIWICTDAGVCRYDGFEFRTFTTKDGLTDNVVFDTYEDRKGRIWFLTYNSMLCYWDGRKISEYQYNDRIRKHLNGRKISVKSLLINEKDYLFYSLNGFGLIEISDKGKLTVIPTSRGSLSVHNVQGSPMISLTRSDSLGHGIQFIDERPESKKRVFDSTFVNNPYSGVGSDNYVRSKQFFYAYDGIYDLNTTKKVFTGNSVITLTIKDSLFWIGQIGNGAVCGKIRNGQFYPNATLLPGYSVTNILVDKDGGIWLSTIESGIFYLKNQDTQHAHLLPALQNDDIISVLDWRGQVFVSTQEYLLNLESGKYFHTFDDPDLYSEVPYYKALRHFYSRFGARGATMRNLNVAYRRHYKHHDGRVFFALDHSIYTYKNDYDDFYEITKMLLDNVDYIQQICIQNEKSIAIYGTELVELRYGTMHAFDVDTESSNTTILNSIYPLLDEAILIGTSNRGLLIRYNNGSVVTIDESKGLLSNKVSVVRTLEDGTILAGSPNGLTVLSPKGKVIKRIAGNDTFGEVSINAICVYNGWVYLGTKTGLLRIKESTLHTAYQVPSTEVLLKGVWFDERFNEAADELLFPANTNLLKIDFSVLQFDNWFSKKYQYRIGAKGQWVDIESPSISLYRPSGEFDIEIRYMDADFQWSSPVKLCHVRVLLPFWMRWYFWTLIGAGVMLLTFYMYQRQQKRINLRLMRENQILQLEQQMLLQQQQMEHARMNPHFIFNVLNSIHSYILHEEMDHAEKYLMMFSRLMREILVKAKEAGISIADEESVLTKYLELEQLRFKGKFMFKVHVNKEDRELIIPSMFVQPFVENAIIHGLSKTTLEDPEVVVRFESEGHHYMRVTVCNSGVISKENLDRLQASGDKNAFGITKKRLENYNTLLKTEFFGIDVVINDEEKPTTCIVLRIPIL